MDKLPPLVTPIENAGFIVLGSFALQSADGAGEGFVVLVGSGGAAFERTFFASAEARDGIVHPLDRWTRRTLGAIAQDLGGHLVLPFDGPPYHPFQRWAQRADPRFHISPLGLLIHPVHGLWIGLRGAIILDSDPQLSAHRPEPSPCDDCRSRPCLSTCPVSAFDGQGYDADGCREHLHGPHGRTCLEGGCLARHACPVGAPWRQGARMARLHMRAFARA
ncbi:MAG: ferredoxin [Geminicoccaceae bacterium]|nr:ferredoxin [Geminicoccaceae bacterium]